MKSNVDGKIFTPSTVDTVSLKVQCAGYWGFYLQNMAEMKYNIYQYVFINV